MKIVVDTNIIIDHLRGEPLASKLLKEVEENVFEGLVSTLTVLELLAAPKLNEERLSAIKDLLKIFEIIAVDRQIASKAGRYLEKYRASHGLEPIDAIIAATARVNEATLFTLNTKHFRFIEGLISLNPYAAGER